MSELCGLIEYSRPNELML